MSDQEKRERIADRLVASMDSGRVGVPPSFSWSSRLPRALPVI